MIGCNASQHPIAAGRQVVDSERSVRGHLGNKESQYIFGILFSAGARCRWSLGGRLSPAAILTAPRSEAAPSASVTVSPLTRSPNFRSIPLRAASVCRLLTPTLPDTGWTGVASRAIERTYQYFAKNRTSRLNWPDARLRSQKLPELSGEPCANKFENARSFDVFFSLRRAISNVSESNGCRLFLHSAAGEVSKLRCPLIDASPLRTNSMPVTSAPFTVMRRGSEATISLWSKEDCALKS